MNRFVVCVTLAAMIASLFAAGCERKEPKDDAVYDPEIDGTLPPLTFDQGDPGLALETARLTLSGAFTTGDAAAAVPSATEVETAPPTAPRQAAIEQARQVVADLLGAAGTGNIEDILVFLAEEDAATYRRILEGHGNIRKKVKQLARLVRSKLRRKMPANLETLASRRREPDPVQRLKNLAAQNIDNLSFSQAGEIVTVTDPTGRQITLKRTSGEWKLTFSEKDRETLTILAGEASRTEKFLDVMIAGIRKGSITRRNIDSESKRLGEKYVAPARSDLAMSSPGASVNDSGAAGRRPKADFYTQPPAASGKPAQPAEVETKGVPSAADQPDANGIIIGRTYRLPNPAGLRIGPKPGQTTKSRPMEPGTKLKILSSYERGPKGMEMTYYQVEAYTANDEKIGVGWISPIEVDPGSLELIEE